MGCRVEGFVRWEQYGVSVAGRGGLACLMEAVSGLVRRWSSGNTPGMLDVSNGESP